MPAGYWGAHRLWTRREDVSLRRRYPNEPTATLARELGRSLASVYQRAWTLGLTKSAAYMASPAACRLRRGGDDHPGKATQFKKGQVPQNKGLRRPGWGPGRMKETQFKKGTRSSRTMPVGSTRLIEGYVYRKVSEVPHVPYTVNWKPEHHLVWQRVHGPVPLGHALQFKDGNRQNCDLSNLELVTRDALMRRNTIHNLPKPLASAIQLLGALKRQIRRRSHHAEEQDRRPPQPSLRDARAAQGPRQSDGPGARQGGR